MNEIKYLDYEGLKQTFSIMKEWLNDKADKDAVCDCIPMTDEEIEDATISSDMLYIKGKFKDGTSSDYFYVYEGQSAYYAQQKTDISQFINEDTNEFVIKLKPLDITFLFADNYGLERIDKIIIPTNIVDVSYLFLETALTKANLSHINTKNLVTLDGIVSYCTNLVELNLSNWQLTPNQSIKGLFTDYLNKTPKLETIYMYNTDETTRGIIQKAIDEAGLTDKCTIVY